MLPTHLYSPFSVLHQEILVPATFFWYQRIVKVLNQPRRYWKSDVDHLQSADWSKKLIIASSSLNYFSSTTHHTHLNKCSQSYNPLVHDTGPFVLNANLSTSFCVGAAFFNSSMSHCLTSLISNTKCVKAHNVNLPTNYTGGVLCAVEWEALDAQSEQSGVKIRRDGQVPCSGKAGLELEENQYYIRSDTELKTGV